MLRNPPYDSTLTRRRFWYLVYESEHMAIYNRKKEEDDEKLFLI